MGIRTHLELQFGTEIITPKTFHLTMIVSYVSFDSSISMYSLIIVTAPSTGQSQVV